MTADHLRNTVSSPVSFAQKAKRKVTVAGQGGQDKRGSEGKVCNGKHKKDEVREAEKSK